MAKMTKKRKNRTKKFILLLLLTIVMFGTSTYAWFTANQVVTINSIDVKVEATNGLQISTNADQWKSVITNSDISTGYSGHKNQLPATVTAVSTDGTVDTTAGTLKLYKGIVGNDASTGDYNITTTLETEAAGTTGDFVAFDVFLRVDQAQTIYLTTSSNVTAKANTEDKGLKNAARVGFVKLGEGLATDSISNLQGLNNSIATKAIIWEPNMDAHSTMVVNTVAPEYGVTLVSNSNTPYYGVNRVISTAVNLKNLVKGTDTTNATSVTPDIKTLETPAAYQQAFNLAAGVTKMRIYLWIEGQDIDCENNATGSDITYDIQLSTQSSAGI